MTQEQENQVEKQCAEAVREIEGDEMIISKELLSEVLGLNGYGFGVTHIGTVMKHNSSLQYSTEKEVHYTLNCHINIHELAHECKEWAFKLGYQIDSRKTEYKNNSYEAIVEQLDYDNAVHCEHAYWSESEPEAIFKACQWIMEQNK